MPAMGLKQIIQNLTLETLLSLPPSDLLALLVLCLLGLLVIGLAFGLIGALFD